MGFKWLFSVENRTDCRVRTPGAQCKRQVEELVNLREVGKSTGSVSESDVVPGRV